ncbi:Dihydrofolate reductase [Seminavis robusta]|uniref:dihydrofolate reductase n=1 Tax=Seminavis robusta TaxID=568900 RepID=A0A9N8HYW4_9STRA|nr:Dihydrofolate reductase [Seminavis robusta]|eukprot:Sro3091_g343550.1 Dihydrofolate reductase (328) ;mRNA; r:1742-2725
MMSLRLLPIRRSLGSTREQWQSAMTIPYRYFSVKELPWCAPKNSPNRKNTNHQSRKKDDRTNQGQPTKAATTAHSDLPEPIDKFGIVAAMSQNRIIGRNGQIPWPRCPQDREIFKNLTRDKLLIIGRRTFQEEPLLRHIHHVRWCIVVTASSKSITSLFQDKQQYTDGNEDDPQYMYHPYAPQTQLQVAPSLPHALGLAREILLEEQQTTASAIGKIDNQQRPQNTNMEELHCWVAGGERLYEEGLKHPSAQEVHLTTMHLTVDVHNNSNPAENGLAATSVNQLAMFPAKHRWDRPFKQVKKEEGGGPSDEAPESPYFTYEIYKRMT